MAKTIFDEVDLPHLYAKNRLVRSATWLALAGSDGAPNDALIRRYEEPAAGGVGTIITGFTTVDAADCHLNGVAQLSDDSLVPAWNRLVDVVHAHGANLIVQLAIGAFIRRRRKLEADDVTEGDLEEIAGLFEKAARRADEAGADGVQIHLAHGFWLSRFIDPAYNHRDDEYGGDQQGRTRLPAEILSAMRRAAPGLHVTAKVNCNDSMRSAFEIGDAIETCRVLQDAGIDSIEVSGNGTSVRGIRPGDDEGYFASFGQALKSEVDVPVIVVGGWRSIGRMDEALNSGCADLLSISRPFIRESDLPKRWLEGDTAPARCISCNRCYNTSGHTCVFSTPRDERR